VSGSGRRFPRCVLFDLDGTLLDSAPDMAATVNRMRAARGVPPMPLAALRPHVSKGARAMSAAAFPGLRGEVPPELVKEFLAVYAEELGHHGAAFEGIEAMLAALEADGTRWGIVTNKPEDLARRLMPSLGWETRSGVLIGGDTPAERKPHPLPLLHAAAAMGFEVADCVYVGDDERDILAARAAGMRSLVALWGYRLEGDEPLAWQADAMVDAPERLLDPEAWP